MAKHTASGVTKAAAIWLAAVSVGHVAAQDSSPSGPTLTGIAANCDAYHTVVSGDTCYSIEQLYDITSDEFLEWNPAVSSDCLTNFWSGYSYCVGVDTSVSTSATPSSASSSGVASQTSTDAISSGTALPSSTSGGFSATSSLSSATSSSSSATDSSFSATGSSSSITSPSSSVTGSSISANASSSSVTSSSSLVANTTIAVKTTTTPYSIRYPVTSYNLTSQYTATAYPPTRTLGGEPSYCNQWHKVASGETCDSIAARFANSVTSAELLEWNPTLGDDCGGLYNGWYICVGTQPQTTLSLGWSTSATNASIPAATAWVPTTPTTTVANFTASPQQTGIPSDCQIFYLAEANDTCTTVLEIYGYLAEDDFFAWNPALGDDCNALWAGYYYCVADYGDDVPMPATVTASPSPTATGTVDTCEAWYQALGDDDCDSIADIFGTFNATDFISWNPSVWSNCANIQEDTYYCVAVPGTPTTRTTTFTPTITASTPTQTSIAADCDQLWLVSSLDTCAVIISDNDLNSTDFYTWNPAVGTDCSGLTPDYYVCVGISSTAISTALAATNAAFVTST
ncbi:hypothetical protein VPNG_01098 [Cytospora leucostoma]|uniref:LysM domain-containing protein n=1 Tax=Cytospora leucostoma TaxID=1230097 RepID=A0A423XKD6_9PEZI|nr:hypothetical protein VPNG_01098 [Cytospora leucostoma]